MSEELEDERSVNLENSDGDNFVEIVTNDFKSGIQHGILVGNLAYQLALELGYPERYAYDLKVAGMIHDIGKLKLSEYLYGRNDRGLSIEEMKYMHMHSKISYDILKNYDFSDEIKEVVLRHHECYDGSGYPDNIKGENIPVGARILKVVDVFAALISDRPYRKAFDIDTAVDIMIDEIKNMDMKVFIAFQRLIHEDSTIELIKNSRIDLDGVELKDLLS